jgi:hypothetical protein
MVFVLFVVQEESLEPFADISINPKFLQMKCVIY